MNIYGIKVLMRKLDDNDFVFSTTGLGEIAGI